MGFFDSIGDFFGGTPEKREQVSMLTPEQMKIEKGLQKAIRGKGASGAFGEAADYYRDLLSPDSETANMMFSPEMRRFNEDIIPGLAEQFAGMGSGALSSSGFRNAAVNAGTDLSERLGAIRASLRQQGAAGLMGLGQQGLVPTSQWQTTQQATPGFLSSMAPAIGSGIGMAIGGPAGAAIGGGLGSAFGASSSKGQTSPYGNQSNGYKGSFGQLPNFMG
jgi:hypothetical protein